MRKVEKVFDGRFIPIVVAALLTVALVVMMIVASPMLKGPEEPLKKIGKGPAGVEKVEKKPAKPHERVIENDVVVREEKAD